MLRLAPEAEQVIAVAPGEDADALVWRVAINFGFALTDPDDELAGASGRMAEALEAVLVHGEPQQRESVSMATMEAVSHLPPDELAGLVRTWPENLRSVAVELEAQAVPDVSIDEWETVWDDTLEWVRHHCSDLPVPAVMTALDDRLRSLTGLDDQALPFPCEYLEFVARNIATPGWRYRHPIRYHRLRGFRRLSG
ncbi:MAG: hypothetical protein JWR55_3386 [Aeromicrobium sp.]|nr:hypothetical protein [Aeromicrobium sp.]